MNKRTKIKTLWNELSLKKKRVFVLVSLLFVLIVGFVLFWGFGRGGFQNKLARDPMSVGGLLPGRTQEEIDALLNTVVEEGMVNIGVSAEPIFEISGKKGRLGIENIPANHYAFQVDLFLENGDLIYQSGLVDPGYHIEFVGLSRTLEAGDYKATAVFTPYTMDWNEDKLTEVQTKVLLHVLDSEYYSK